MPPTTPRASLCAQCDFQHCAPTTTTSSSPLPPPPAPPLPPIANVPLTTASTGPADVVNDLVYQADRLVGVAGATFADVYGARRRTEAAAAASAAESAALRWEGERLRREKEGLRGVVGAKKARIWELEERERMEEGLGREMVKEMQERLLAEVTAESMVQVVKAEGERGRRQGWGSWRGRWRG
ncbi:hypothetical protein NpNSSI1_00004418 [Neofusicoccum parvum]|nr:hypothetical protein NpNSSI1_00004418 [Neofusicoccum parvum]